MADEEDEYEGLLRRHKIEKKELQGKIQGLKHGVPKGDKKKKKEITAEIAILEAKLDEKHSQEINDFLESKNQNVTECEIISELENLDVNAPKKITRAQKRRDKKAVLEKERQERIKQGEIENINSARNEEQRKLTNILSPMGLEIHEIAPDGHCLYRAIADQLQRNNIQHDYKSLRQLAATYIQENAQHFLPFLIDHSSGNSYTPEQFVKYCEDIADTAAWGGELEIQAISSSLQMPVKIFQAKGPIVEIAQENKDTEILLSYHHHAYGLGNHYNSVIKTEQKNGI